MQQGRLQPWCRCSCYMVMGLTPDVTGVTPCKKHCCWGTNNLQAILPEQSTPSSVLREAVGFKVSIQQSLLTGAGEECLKILIIWRLRYGLVTKLWKHCFSFPSLKLSRILRTSWHSKIKLEHDCLPANDLCIHFFKAGTYLCVHEWSICVKSLCAPTRVTC